MKVVVWDTPGFQLGIGHFPVWENGQLIAHRKVVEAFVAPRPADESGRWGVWVEDWNREELIQAMIACVPDSQVALPEFERRTRQEIQSEKRRLVIEYLVRCGYSMTGVRNR